MSYASLSNANIERLAMLAEEAGNTAKAAMRVLRFGYDSHPSHSEVTNRTSLARRVGNLHSIIEEMVKIGDLPAEGIAFAMAQRATHKPKYTIHQPYSLPSSKRASDAQ